jgi:hypothetical protein
MTPYVSTNKLKFARYLLLACNVSHPTPKYPRDPDSQKDRSNAKIRASGNCFTAFNDVSPTCAPTSKNVCTEEFHLSFNNWISRNGSYSNALGCISVYPALSISHRTGLAIKDVRPIRTILRFISRYDSSHRYAAWNGWPTVWKDDIMYADREDRAL